MTDRAHRTRPRRWGPVVAAVIVAATAASLARSPGVAGADDHTRWNLKAVDEFIVPGYRALAAATVALDRTVPAYCDGGGDDGLEELRARFADAMDAWQSIQVIRFGAIDLELRWQRIQFWPDERDITGRHLHGLRRNPDPGALEPRTFRSGSVAVQGLAALERLLYAGDESDAGPRDCAILSAIGANLASIGRQLVAEWSGDGDSFRRLVARAGPDNAFFHDPAEVAARLLGDMRTALEVIAHRKIGAPLGESAQHARPRQAESWRSGRSLANIRRNVESIHKLYAVAFAARVAGSELDTRIRSALADLERLLGGLEQPLAELVAEPDGRRALTGIRERTIALERMVAAELSAALDLTIGFNSLDGD